MRVPEVVNVRVPVMVNHGVPVGSFLWGMLGSVGVLTRVDRRSKKGGGRPSTVPSHPEVTYADEGWLSWGDWLGTEPGKVAEKR